MTRFAPLVLATLLASVASAQTTFSDPANLAGERPTPLTGRELPIDGGQGDATLGLQQLLRKLSTRASILNIVAHPDDEDGGMLTLNARGLGARVADLSLTRGEGGQNAMTGDFEDALGLLRTQELLANDRYTGVSQMFGTEVDFGFSKTKTEAFSKWTHQRVLYDAVRAIRIYRPLVITATFIGEPTDGHGQHQVSGEIAQEAFLAAGDPTIFPELTREGILPWQPLKMYARVPTYAISSKGLYDYATNQYVPAEFTNYVTGQKTTTPPSADIVIHEGAPDPLLTVAGANRADLPPHLASQPPSTELSYIQFSRLGLGLQKSQIGPGFRNAPSGAFDVSYHLYGSCLPGSPTAKLCHLDANAPDADTSATPSANGATHNSLGRSPRYAADDDKGLQARHINPSDTPNFFDGIDTTVESISSLAPDSPLFAGQNWADFLQHLRAGLLNCTAHVTEDACPLELAAADTSLEKIISSTNKGRTPPPSGTLDALHELTVKHAQLNAAIALALGVQLNATTASAEIPEGTEIQADVSLTIRSSSAQLAFIGFSANHSAFQCLAPGEKAATEYYMPAPFSSPVTRSCKLPEDFTSRVTRPYFSRPDVESAAYDLADPSLRNAPLQLSPIYATAILKFGDAYIVLDSPLRANGQAVSIVPPVSLSMSQRAAIMLRWREPGTAVDASFTSQYPALSKLDIRLAVPTDWKLLSSSPISSAHYSFLVQAPEGSSVRSGTVTASVSLPTGATFAEGYRAVGYPGLPYTNIYTPARELLVPTELHLPQGNPRIAYLPGTGDSIPEAIQSLGMNAPTTLTVDDLTPANLAKFDTVILGVRTYSAHPDLHGAPTQALLDFAKQGGNVLVQYQTDEFTAADAPYPLSLGSNEKVVDETAPVELLGLCDQPGSKPPHPCEQNSMNNKGSIPGSMSDYRLLTTPNRITPHDFDNWFEERGHGFLESWDSHYTALLETHDPGAPSEHVAPQTPQRGGLITTQLGKGRWTYCAFALYRQLPEANPGAFRLFVNLINP